MSFTHFLTLLLAVYTLYYGVLFSIDQIGRRSVQAASDDRIDFVTAPVITPVKVSGYAPVYQMDDSASEEQQEDEAQEKQIERSGIVHPVSGMCLAYDLGLETLTATTGIPVDSPKFWSLFGS